MKGIIIAFSRLEDGRNIRRALERNGFEDMVLCQTGAQALREAAFLERGLLICGVRLKDMHCTQLREYLPPGVELLVVGTEARLADCPPDLMSVTAPVRVYELVNTVGMMLGRNVPEKRKKQEGRAGSVPGKPGEGSPEGVRSTKTSESNFHFEPNVRPTKTRSEADQRAIRQAKELLMERNRLTEEGAHRYLQKRSMETGRTMAESARMVLMLFEND